MAVIGCFCFEVLKSASIHHKKLHTAPGS